MQRYINVIKDIINENKSKSVDLINKNIDESINLDFTIRYTDCNQIYSLYTKDKEVYKHFLNNFGTILIPNLQEFLVWFDKVKFDIKNDIILTNENPNEEIIYDLNNFKYL